MTAMRLGQNFIRRWTAPTVDVGEGPEQTLNVSF
jgi:hypothetical protein